MAMASEQLTGGFSIRPMQAEDFPAMLSLWQRCEGIGLNSADTPEGTALFLKRNPGLSLVLLKQGELAGTCLAGHDGRRGFLYHLAIDPADRKKGMGAHLAGRCTEALLREGILRCHIVVYASNREGQTFWKKLGWQPRENLLLMSTELPLPFTQP